MKTFKCIIAVVAALAFSASALKAESVCAGVAQIATISGQVNGAAISRLLLKFDEIRVPSGSAIDYAELSWPVSSGNGSITIECLPLATDWNSTTVSWTSPWTTPGGDYRRTGWLYPAVDLSAAGKLAIDMTVIVDGWMKNSGNYGVVVKRPRRRGRWFRN
ncbi:MAG: DNRLRE domain-containing protein [Candidatus Edwardsbacteria bacterium]|nr:DNRLRE domain-containing protein [Candidatus Edwardsbacteria bacterium]